MDIVYITKSAGRKNLYSLIKVAAYRNFQEILTDAKYNDCVTVQAAFIQIGYKAMTEEMYNELEAKNEL